MTRLTTTLLPLLLATTATAHFRIDSPPGNDPSNENKLASGPCGGADLDFDNKDVHDFHVGGDAIGATGTHSQSNWLFRATLDTTGEGNWTMVWPIAQTGLGKYCQPQVTVPEEWVGEQGLIGVVAHAEDGILYGVSFDDYFCWLCKSGLANIGGFSSPLCSALK